MGLQGGAGSADGSPKQSSEDQRPFSREDRRDDVYEQSPLLSPSSSRSEEEEGLIHDVNVLEEHDDLYDTKGVWYMVLLTISIGGLQLAWAVEISNGTPYLLSLGLSKSLMALVWIAGPLSGTLVQPYIGILSDNCRSSWGKRTPYMIVGTITTIVSLLALAWVREMVGGTLGLFGADRESEGVKTMIIIVAVLFIYLLDIAINTVQAGIRAFILDCAPSHQQEAANSMASRVVGVGNIIGYVAGYVDLPKHMGFFGNTQFKVLCVIASLALGSTIFLSLSTIKERDASHDPVPTGGKSGISGFFKQVVTSIRTLPPQTRKVCEVQFFAWIGIFPQLFYSSSYVGDIYVQSFLEADPNMTPEEIDTLYENATRVGTFALLIYAITSLATNVLLPFLIAPTYDKSTGPPKSSRKGYTTRMSRLLDAVVIPWLTLRRAWLIGHLIFSGCMFSTLFVRSIGGATAIIGIVGVSWALTLWAPFAIISAEISKRHAMRRTLRSSAREEGADDEMNDQAGVVLGIHNMSIAAPQILATLGSSIIFKMFQKPRGVVGDRSIAIVLACGGIFTLIAAVLTSRIKDEVEIQTAEEAIEEGNGSRRRSSEVPLVRSESMNGLEY